MSERGQLARLVVQERSMEWMGRTGPGRQGYEFPSSILGNEPREQPWWRALLTTREAGADK